MQFVLELLVAIFVEVVLQVVAEIVLELGWEAAAHSIRSGRSADPVIACVGLIVVGATVGLASCWLFPRPMLRPLPHLRGLSLLVSPIVTGAAMHAFGMWRRRRENDPTLLATFWGGGVFALAIALARWWCVGRA